MIFGNLILGGFGISISQMSQVQTILSFQGCDKMVLRLHTAGTENPDTPKHIRAPSISMNTIQITQIPIRHTPYTPQTPPRHLQGARDANRRQQTPTDKSQDMDVYIGSIKNVKFACNQHYSAQVETFSSLTDSSRTDQEMMHPDVYI